MMAPKRPEVRQVFPARAGMNRCRARRCCRTNGVPRPRGDEPETPDVPVLAEQCSGPCVREERCTVIRSPLRGAAKNRCGMDIEG